MQDTVEVKVDTKTLAYWLSKGYELPKLTDCRGRPRQFKKGVTRITVKVSDLPIKSNVRIKVRCDKCQKERLVAYSKYSDICWACNLSDLQYKKGIYHPKYLQRVKTGGAERAFDLYLRRRYGVTADFYFDLLSKQEHKCAACKREQATEGRRFALDHNHETKKVRGILCQPCNTSLGLLKTNKDTLRALITYLELNNE